MIEQIARHLCEADGYDPDIIGSSGNPRWWLYTRTAEHTIPFLAEAWEEGAETAWNRSTPEVNGTRYHWRHEGDPVNPYRGESGVKARAEFNRLQELAEARGYDRGFRLGWDAALDQMKGQDQCGRTR